MQLPCLAVDITRRLNPIYERFGFRLSVRTGDIKRKGGSQARILITTPESLDVLLGSPNKEYQAFLRSTQTLIIDEVHLFLHQDRGYHLACLRERLSRLSQFSLQTIAMSATVPLAESVISMFHMHAPVFTHEEPTTKVLEPNWICLKDGEEEFPLFFEDLYQRLSYRKLIVFANTRKACEELYALMCNQNSSFKNIFLHYSNLSSTERKRIEKEFRSKNQAICIATSTLEVGIDVGDVDGVILTSPPHSPSTFLQRIGRGNRRENCIRFWGICQTRHPEKELLRYLSLFSLAKENKIERLPDKEIYSIIFQQILSLMYTKGKLSLSSLHSLYPNDKDSISAIFHRMIEKRWIKESDYKGLFIGGWRYYNELNEKRIWSNFPATVKEYEVILEDGCIAVLPETVVTTLKVGEIIQLAGMVLIIIQIVDDLDQQYVLTKRGKVAEKVVDFIGSGCPVPYEVAQGVKDCLLSSSSEGLYKRTRELLEEQRELIEKTARLENGIYVTRLSTGGYRYSTYLGSIGNAILKVLIQNKVEEENFCVDSDECHLESTHWIDFQKLSLPTTEGMFKNCLEENFRKIKHVYTWNKWLKYLPNQLQEKEVISKVFDKRLLEHFSLYKNQRSVSVNGILLDETVDFKQTEIPSIQAVELLSIEEEKKDWGELSFPSTLSFSSYHGKSNWKLCATPVVSKVGTIF